MPGQLVCNTLRRAVIGCFASHVSLCVLSTCIQSKKNILFCLNAFNLQAAKETGALQEAKNKLEKEVDELTWRLQLEKRMRVRIIVDEP